MFSVSDRSENVDTLFDFGSETDDSDMVDFFLISRVSNVMKS